MTNSGIGFTPRLRMTRHSPTHERTPSSISEAGPSRLPEYSQLVNLTMKDMDISDDNMYASDIPTEHTPHPPLQASTKTGSPATVLRALLSRLPNKEEHSMHRPNHEPEHQYPSERESDYDVETASVTPSVAQSSLKNIFSRALREPGDTPQKNNSYRLRSNSIGASDVDNTPRVWDAVDLKGKRKSMSDDELDHGNTSARNRFRKTPQPLTKEFLREHFGKRTDVSERHNATLDENGSFQEIFAKNLDSSRTSPPVATSTPQRSLISFNHSKFNSNLLDKDSGMQNAFDALENSVDNMSSRSVSPVPTLQMESDQVDNRRQITIDEPTISGNSLFKDKDLSSRITTTAKASRSKLIGNDRGDSLGEQSMSLSLPVGHFKLQHDLGHSQLTNGANGRLSRQHSNLSSRPSSPLPDHLRPHTPVDDVHEKERNWNKPQSVRNRTSSSNLSRRPSTPSIRPSSPMQNRGQGSESPSQPRERKWSSPHRPRHDNLSPHHSPNHSFSSRPKSPLHRPETPVDPTHVRERNWNSPHPKWHEGSLSPLLPDHIPRSRRPSTPSPENDLSRSTTPAMKKGKAPIKISPPIDGAGRSKTDFSTTQYVWPVISSEPRHTSPSSIPNGHTSDADDVRDTDLSSSDTPKSRPSDRHLSVALKARDSRPLTPATPKNENLDVLQGTPTPPRDVKKSLKSGFRTPSPPRTLPELPTPSSSDESDGSPMKKAKIPKLVAVNEKRWLQTPKPPGGWLQTPRPGKHEDDDALPPETPVAPGTSRGVGKTPKPPGGWSTPAPRSLQLDEREGNDQKSQLLTPVNSLSKGTFLDPKTPAAPGAWINTPAARKSVLKVRFDSQTPEIREESRSYLQDSASESRDEEPNGEERDDSLRGQSSLNWSPRRPKANIRVLDAFGREETPNSSPKKDRNGSQSGIRVLDAMGREVEDEQSEEQGKSSEENGTSVGQSELLSRLKRDLDGLVKDLGDSDEKEDLFTDDRVRIEELVATSKHARAARRQLISENKRIISQIRLVKSWYVKKVWFGLMVVLFFMMVNRIIVVQTRKFILTTYYDPFKPDIGLRVLEGYTSPLRRDGNIWNDWFGFMDIDEYLSGTDFMRTGRTPT